MASQVRALFQLIDLDASGAIDHQEFYQLLHFLHVELPKVRRLAQGFARRWYFLTGPFVAYLQARHALQVDTGEMQSIEKMSEEQLNTMAAGIIKKLDVDGDGEISLDEFMIWLDSYPDADVTDLFSLLQSIVETT